MKKKTIPLYSVDLIVILYCYAKTTVTSEKLVEKEEFDFLITVFKRPIAIQECDIGIICPAQLRLFVGQFRIAVLSFPHPYYLCLNRSARKIIGKILP